MRAVMMRAFLGVALSAANEAAWSRPGLSPLCLDEHAFDIGRDIAINPFNQPWHVSGQVITHFRYVRAQTRQVDEIEIGALTRCEYATIMEAISFRIIASQFFDHEFEWQVVAMADWPVTRPLSQHVRVHAAIGEGCGRSRSADQVGDGVADL